MRYDSHINNIDSIIKAYEYYLNNNESQKKVSDKFDINYHAFVRYSKQFKGGAYNNRNIKIEVKNTPVNTIKKEAIKKEKTINFMESMKGGRNNKNVGNFIDEINKIKKSESVFAKKENNNSNQNISNKNNEQKSKSVKSIYDVLPEKYQNFD
jgi:hypothetical protein